MAQEKDEKAHAELADKVLAKLPKQVRDRSEVVPGGGAYSLLKVDGRTVASVRGNGARVTYRTADAAALAGAVKAAIESAPSDDAKQDAADE